MTNDAVRRYANVATSLTATWHMEMVMRADIPG